MRTSLEEGNNDLEKIGREEGVWEGETKWKDATQTSWHGGTHVSGMTDSTQDSIFLLDLQDS